MQRASELGPHLQEQQEKGSEDEKAPEGDATVEAKAPL